jgi:hypothetical protein
MYDEDDHARFEQETDHMLLSLSLSLKTSVQNITCEFQFIDCIGRHLERWWQASKLCEEHLKSREEIGVSPDSKQNI